MPKENPDDTRGADYREKFLADFQRIQKIQKKLPQKNKELKKKVRKQEINFKKKIRIKKKKIKRVQMQIKQNERLITRSRGMRRKIENMNKILKDFGDLIELPQSKWSEVVENPEKYGVEKDEIVLAQQLLQEYQTTLKELEKSENLDPPRKGRKKGVLRKKLGKRSKLSKKGMATRKKWIQM